MAKQQMSDLIKQLKDKKTIKSIQKVTPVKEKDRNEVQFSFYLDKNLLKRIKQEALNKDESIKAIINNALEAYLKNN